MDTNNNALFIFGGSSTALEIAEAVAFQNPEFKKYFVVGNGEALPDNSSIRDEDLEKFIISLTSQKYFILSQSDHKVRSRCLEAARKLSLKPHTVIHPKAFVSGSAQLGAGVYVAAQSVVSSGAVVGEHSMLNMGMVFGHDASCGMHFIGSPGCVVGGNVHMGNNVFMGANSFVYQGLEVGNDVQVDALTYIYKNIQDRKLCSNRNLTVVNRVFIA